MTTKARSARDCAQAYTTAKTAAAKKKIRDEVAAHAEKSKRARWTNLLKAIDAGDTARIKARAETDWSAVNAAKPKAEPKAPAKAKTTRKAPAKKAPASADPDLAGVAKALGISEAQLTTLAAFFKG